MWRIFSFLTVSLSLGLPSLLGIEGTRKEIYKTVGDVALAAYLFEPEGHQPSDARPAAVFFFGGGWNSGSPEQFAPHARYLASRGMVGIVADYRVKSRHGTTPFECVADGKSAVRWLRTHASRLGIDPNRIAVGGGSAGGHVAAATATLKGLDDPQDDLAVSPRPNALILFNPVYDNGPEGYGHERVGDRYREISPWHNIAEGMPPAIVFFGTEDNLVPVATAEAFQAKMRAVGSRSELHLYEGQGHAFFNHPQFRPGSSPIYYYKTVSAADRFLASLGWLQGNPTLNEPRFTLRADNAAEALEIRYAGTPVARYLHAFDDSSDERRHETYKPFLHVYNPKGTRFLTKGPGGRFTHHRGIFLGFSRLGMNEQRYDLWHMKQGVQMHQAFTAQAADANEASFTSRIAWQTNEGDVLLLEHRTYTIRKRHDHGMLQIDQHSSLQAIAGDAEMNGDPEHAGAQFRPADDIVASETTYTFPHHDIDPKKDLDLPWVGETFRLATGKARYSVVIFNHPQNPKGTRFSAYRDYGRFGAFPTFTIPQNASATLRYRWWVGSGSLPARAHTEKAHASYSSE